MAVLIYDPEMERRALAKASEGNPDRLTEVWEGVTVVPPMPNTEHNRLVSRINEALASAVDWDGGDESVAGGNVSDRDDGWEHNFRCPDIIVALAGGRAVNSGTHWRGGPDLVAEVISPGEDPQAKFTFYAAVGCREVLVIDRNPWAVELYRLTRRRYKLVGRSDLSAPVVVTSAVIPVTLQLVAARPRPWVVVTNTRDGRTWKA